MKRTIVVTTALPYANGVIHLGHLTEHIQADIWVRFQKMQGHDCYFLSADDTHGTPVMLAAEKKGITPEELINTVKDEHERDFREFLVDYDNYYTTHSPESEKMATKIFHRLQAAGKISTKDIAQLFDPEKKMFLPDRFVKGGCPRCKAAEQYGDNCEVCGATYDPTELIAPYSAVSGAKPVLKTTSHYFFKLSECRDFLQAWVQGQDTTAAGVTKAHLQPEALNKMREWLSADLKDWDITRDAPYFGFKIPGSSDKYFYVWLDAPIGYMASLLNLAARRAEINFTDFFAPAGTAELYHFIGKDILYFHALFWPATLKYSGFRTPTSIFTHGFLTVDGQKMSKSRGTFITARAYLTAGLNPEWLRYYFAAKMNARIEDIDLNLADFAAKVNSDLVGKYVNIAARAAGFIEQKFAGKLADVNQQPLLAELRNEAEAVAAAYENREFAAAVKIIMQAAAAVNSYCESEKPWTLAKITGQEQKLQEVCSVLLNAFKILTVYLAPILPQTAERARIFLNMPALCWDDIFRPLPTLVIKPYRHLLQRIEPRQIQELLALNPQSAV